MNLYIRLFLTWLKTLRESRMSTSRTCSQWFRVWPHDLDIFGHMNNGRYLQVMDVARMRWLLRTGVIDTIRRKKWTVALGGNMTRFRRPLSLFTRYRVTSHLRCWDERWFYLVHVFYDSSGAVVSVGNSRAAFRYRGRWVRTREVMDNVDPGATSPPIPDHMMSWMSAEDQLFQDANSVAIGTAAGFSTNQSCRASASDSKSAPVFERRTARDQ